MDNTTTVSLPELKVNHVESIVPHSMEIEARPITFEFGGEFALKDGPCLLLRRHSMSVNRLDKLMEKLSTRLEAACDEVDS